MSEQQLCRPVDHSAAIMSLVRIRRAVLIFGGFFVWAFILSQTFDFLCPLSLFVNRNKYCHIKQLFERDHTNYEINHLN